MTKSVLIYSISIVFTIYANAVLCYPYKNSICNVTSVLVYSMCIVFTIHVNSVLCYPCKNSICNVASVPIYSISQYVSILSFVIHARIRDVMSQASSYIVFTIYVNSVLCYPCKNSRCNVASVLIYRFHNIR